MKDRLRALYRDIARLEESSRVLSSSLVGLEYENQDVANHLTACQRKVDCAVLDFRSSREWLGQAWLELGGLLDEQY